MTLPNAQNRYAVTETSDAIAAAAGDPDLLFDSIASTMGDPNTRSIQEVSKFLVACGQVALAQIPEILTTIDVNGDGIIDREEWRNFCTVPTADECQMTAFASNQLVEVDDFENLSGHAKEMVWQEFESLESEQTPQPDPQTYSREKGLGRSPVTVPKLAIPTTAVHPLASASSAPAEDAKSSLAAWRSDYYKATRQQVSYSRRASASRAPPSFTCVVTKDGVGPIGVSLHGKEDAVAKVVAVAEGSPASRSIPPLVAGMRLVSIDGTKVFGAKTAAARISSFGAGELELELEAAPGRSGRLHVSWPSGWRH